MESINSLETNNISAEDSYTQTDISPKKIKGFEKNWFWIALLSFICLFYTVEGAITYFDMATELGGLMPLTRGFMYVVGGAGVLFSPPLFKRLGIMDNARKFKTCYLLLSAVGIASMVMYAVYCNTLLPYAVWPALVLQYISMLVPACVAGCALNRAVKTMSAKSASVFGGLMYAIVLTVAILHALIFYFFWSWHLFQISFIVVYAIQLIVPAILLILQKDTFEYTAPKHEYFSEPLFIKFMLLAIIMASLDAFYEGTYYAGGSYGDFSLFFTFLLQFLMIPSCLLITFLLHKGKWFPVMAFCTLALCFQQGLILFFNNNDQLAVAYVLMDTFSGVSTMIFLLFIPIAYCVQRRKNASAVTGIVAIWLFMKSITEFFSEVPGYNFSALVAPAVTFTLSIAAIAFLFYLHNEHDRVYYNTLINDIRGQFSKETLTSDEAMAEAGFTEDERKVTLLLIEGETRYGISRKLHRPVAEISRDMDSIREKVISKSDPDPGIAATVRAFDLTRRETDTLRCLCRNMTNVDIAEELVISEETVKKHVRSLMKKLPVEDRKDVADYVKSLGM